MATTYPGGMRKRGGLLDYEDTIQATPRNPYLGAISDLLGQAYRVEMPRIGVPGLDLAAANKNRLLDLLGVGDVQKTAEAMSYGNALGTGAGMTYRPYPETIGAAMTAASLAPSAARLAGKGAAEVGRYVAPKAGLLAENYMADMGMMPSIVPLAKTKVLGYDPQTLATRYPLVLPGVQKIDPKTGKEFIGKQLSAEAEAVSKARKAAQKDIDAGRYTPYYDVSKRDYVDPTNYPLQGSTLTDIVPAKPETVAKYQAIYDTPEARANISGAYEKAVNDPLAHNWYAMKQYEDDFIKQFGEERGRQMFKERFAEAMASTTGGADPTSNYLMAQYGNYLRQQGIAQPTSAVDFPFPIGGRYASGNMALYDKIINQGQGLTVQNPKRFNFSSNFLGYRDRPTIDEQMSQLYQGGLLAPFPNTYGIAEGVLNDVAKSKGVMPVNLQDVAWIGAKGTTGKPMIQNINEAIERTSRVTGLPQDEVLKLMIRSGIPTY